MTALPARTGPGSLTDPATTVVQQKDNLGDQRDYLAELFGVDGTIDTARRTARLLDANAASNYKIVPSVAGSALTLTLAGRDGNPLSATNPAHFSFRNATLGAGDFNLRAVTAPIALTVSSGSTLGAGNGDTHWLYIYVLDNAGAVELVISGSYLGIAGTMSTTAEGGAGGADNGTFFYSAVARANVAFRCIGRMKAPQGAAGAWATLPTIIEPLPFEFTGNVIARATNGVLSVQDNRKTILAFASFTQTFDSAATLGDGWSVAYNAQGFSITFDPAGADTIDGAATKTVTGSGFIYCNGGAFFTIGFPSHISAIPKTITFIGGGSGTYTTPAGVVALRVRMVGAGGGGGTNYTYSGSNGGSTGFGSYGCFGGSGGGPGPSYGGAPGGTTGTGHVHILGGYGQGGTTSASGNIVPPSSCGGASVFGGAGMGVPYANAGNPAAPNTGSGGSSGGGNVGYDIGAGGGAGGYLEVVIYAPAATYSYVVGAGGAGAGANSFAGGDGASGCIIVEEYYAS